MRRRRPIGKKRYTIFTLLDKQPKSLSRSKHYSLMIGYLRDSPALQRIKFNQRCYSLLNNAVIKPEHLDNFYRTYHLPINPFFPLFFMIKREYLLNKELSKVEKRQYIQEKMKILPKYIDDFFRLLADLERSYNRGDKIPVYKNSLIPKTKKQVNLFNRNNHSDWIFFFKNYLNLLMEQYKRMPLEKTDQLLACFILICIPNDCSRLPNQSVVRKHYRSFSKKYHPDTGGDHGLFIEIKWAYDILSKT